MWGARWLVLPVALTALAVGCSSSGPRPRIEEPQSASPTEMRTRTAEESVPKAELAKLGAFLDKATPIFAGTVPDAFSLEDLRYTSRTDAAASFSDCRNVIRDPCSTVIATTHDNWAHAAGLVIPDTLADLVDFAALGRGMVGIKAEDQFSDPGRSYPPFILYPDGRVRPLHVSYRPQAFDSGSDLLISDYDLSLRSRNGDRDMGFACRPRGCLRASGLAGGGNLRARPWSRGCVGERRRLPPKRRRRSLAFRSERRRRSHLAQNERATAAGGQATVALRRHL